MTTSSRSKFLTAMEGFYILGFRFWARVADKKRAMFSRILKPLWADEKVGARKSLASNRWSKHPPHVFSESRHG